MQNAKHNCIGWKQEGAHGAIDAYMRHSSATARLIYVEMCVLAIAIESSRFATH